MKFIQGLMFLTSVVLATDLRTINTYVYTAAVDGKFCRSNCHNLSMVILLQKAYVLAVCHFTLYMYI